ncbi:hypothetical protein WJX73_005826 [Symbiochloris irregularis]|uniref:N-end rule aminoacyl transferase C-terminal domain-containing protein n=1 Tax=Symbiochloris irregularis TaxID=706552 RepID=A0AAW1NVW2_9CHLO
MRTHHEEEPKLSSFQNFLVSTPLMQPGSAQAPGQGPLEGYGSYHQQYWLDGVLIAVAVLDVLPGYLSSVYFFWDPDLGHMSLGKVSTMNEIEWVRAQSAGPNAAFPLLKHYTMGFYIHSCPKMRYKAEYRPSQLLCPQTFTFVPLEPALLALTRQSLL